MNDFESVWAIELNGRLLSYRSETILLSFVPADGRCRE